MNDSLKYTKKIKNKYRNTFIKNSYFSRSLTKQENIEKSKKIDPYKNQRILSQLIFP